MKLLAIDVSTSACSVALLSDASLHAEYELKPREQTRSLLPMIDRLLDQAKLKLAELDAIAISVGPGSFTGIRIGVGVVQGLALPHDTPIIPISTLAATAQTAYRLHGLSKVAVATDAHMGEIYFACYALGDNDLMKAVLDDQLVKPADLKLPEGDFEPIGQAWRVYESLPLQQSRAELVDIYPQAEDVMQLAKQKFLAGDMQSAETVLPVYLRKKDAWQK